MMVGYEAYGQTTLISGMVFDSSQIPVQGVRVILRKGGNTSDTTGKDGTYHLTVPSGKKLKLIFIYQGNSKKEIEIGPLRDGAEATLPPTIIATSIEKQTIIISKQKEKERANFRRLDPKNFLMQPSPTGDIKSIIEKFAGVSSNNELSTQYNVRGGNYDENLVYINDIEIFRPLLVRSGQQEGLSIINPHLVQSLSFSAGGFEARYGDKLSSALDIVYKQPDTFHLYLSGSLLGGGISFEGSNETHRFRYLGGVRYRTNRYLLNTLDVKGQYRPNFTDGQMLLMYDINPNVELSYFTYYGNNSYTSFPQSQATTFGAVNQAYRLNVDFAGREIIQYSTLLNGLTLRYQANKTSSYKFINSFYYNDEQERFDIIGQYSLDQVETDLGSENFGKSVGTLGYGGYLNHGRNILRYTIYNSEVKGEHIDTSGWMRLSWGLKFQQERINDKLSEYRYLDSSDYSSPDDTTIKNRGILRVNELIDGSFSSQWNRYSGYLQNAFPLAKAYNAQLIIGARFNYWDYNKELLISPRAQFVIEPNAKFNRGIALLSLPDSVAKLKMKRNTKFKASVGSYQQPPFYREFRQFNGNVNPEIRAQKSIQAVVGSDIMLELWKRPFRFTTEAYYKHLTDLIPYEIDNVRIRYYGTNNAKGYATGLDFMLSGDLVKDNPSYVSFSVMKTAEDLKDDVGRRYSRKTGQYENYSPGYIPRPSDQRFRFAMFFQDYLPKNPSYKAHISLIYGSGLPFGPPDFTRYKDTLRMPPYRRVDIGFSRLIYDKNKKKATKGLFKGFSSVWASLEIFNTFGINNTISYLWIQDLGGNRWGVPNYLTGRRFNLHLEVKL
jgi:hypothetical protein